MVGLERAIVEVTMAGMRELGDLSARRPLRRRDGTCGDRRRTAVVRALERQHATAVPLDTIGPGDLGPTELHTIGLEAFAVLLGRRGWPIRVLRRAHPHGCAHHRAHVLPSRRDGRHRSAQRRAARSDREPSCGGSPLGSRGLLRGVNALSTPRSREGVPGTYLGTDLIAAAELVCSVIR